MFYKTKIEEKTQANANSSLKKKASICSLDLTGYFIGMYLS